MTKIEEIGKWVKKVNFSDIPQRVIEKAKYQILSILASLYSGMNSKGGKIILKTIKEQKILGKCSIIPDSEKTSLQNAVIANSAFSISYDFDDYIFMGHPSHSAVIVPIAIAEELNLGGKEILTSQVVANEVAGRLGASCIIGPHNGQTWSFIHSISSACATAKLMKLDQKQIENAIAIALYQPNYVLFPGFIGYDTKLLTAGIPAAVGIFSAFLARNNFTGSKEIIEHPQGFLRHFSFVPNEFMLTGFGKTWVLDTIGYKIYPGCAYIDSTIDALLEVMKKFRKEKRRKLKISDVKEIVVESTLLTVGMDGLTKDSITSGEINSVLINFSIPLSVAVTIIAGRLTSNELTDNFLNKHKREILNLSKKVKLNHSPSMTLNLIQEIEKAGLLEIFLNNINLREIITLPKNLKKGAGQGIPFEFKDFLYLLKLSSKDKEIIKSLIEMTVEKNIFRKLSNTLADVDFKNLRMPFSAEVKLFTSDGSLFEKYVEIPLGAQGSGTDREIFGYVINKFRNEAEKYISKTKVKEIIEMIGELENIKNISKFIENCCLNKN